MVDKIDAPKTVKITISISEELFEAIAIESNLRKMNRSRVIETILRENKRINKNIRRIHEIMEKEKDVIITAGHGIIHNNVPSPKSPNNTEQDKTKTKKPKEIII